MVTKVIALAGANGHVGKALSSVKSATLQELKTIGPSIHVISYNDEASIVSALQGVDVLVSTVSGTAIASAQIPLIIAAKTAGMKLFFPSEYGGVYEDGPGAPHFVRTKNSVIKSAQVAGLPFAVVSNGAFPEYYLIPPFGYNFAGRKVSVWGDGNAKISRTTLDLQRVEIDPPLNGYKTDTSTSRETNTTSVKLQVDYHPLKELEDRIDANENDILAFLLRESSSGGGEIGGADNDMHPDWKPESLRVIL
ncbi:NmrA-like family-domain-containing protein [Rhizoctonia solani]|nr:NmrA-like family-domain-containing protein [Rhizoctonia solani]